MDLALLSALSFFVVFAQNGIENLDFFSPFLLLSRSSIVLTQDVYCLISTWNTVVREIQVHFRLTHYILCLV